MLYLIPTPIGNREDITARAQRLLGEVDLILAEDTRTSRPLLQHYGIETPLRAYHAHNEHALVEQLVTELKNGSTYALITDAGTPGISDPGFLLVRACREAGIQVSCLPGPVAFVPALAASGIPCDRFHFEGFLPKKKGRQTRLLYLAELPNTFVLYESPHRIAKLLGQLEEHCGPDRQACVAREISKRFEEITTAPLSELRADYAARPKVKGEIVVVVAGTP
ncbi:16S rRNA (cytidine1402-2'-O)-methyltransferase [Lewinella marina]|uniref:Ribosomal RNA small subunit methyltransferase I n=1 Tax=Neolewinella marina TaxID=438751 RepID=A0A2G0CEQ4_9BACT|nr:16S rRNA (cytidine(1402)-2'-O)-methyltransferase [Neolewinella marina]NJB87231.1 16S rRNA (cytidine1402-2'-O)-methyltransferase [Neolewinella marina]PHK98442.1 16S rRNA (cytidine(1402)-2'-O)-methyltransferase [Neolewinella marina]